MAGLPRTHQESIFYYKRSLNGKERPISDISIFPLKADVCLHRLIGSCVRVKVLGNRQRIPGPTPVKALGYQRGMLIPSR